MGGVGAFFISELLEVRVGKSQTRFAWSFLSLIILINMILSLQNHLTLNQNALFNAVFQMPVSDSWGATCWGSGKWGNYTFDDYEIGLD